MHTRTTLSPCKNKNDRQSRRGRRARPTAPAPAALTFAVSLSFGSVPLAIAGPTGGVVVNGQGSISTPKAGATVVNQSSSLLQLNWNTFNVNQGESVQFRQPSSTSVAFNRILDQNPSQIFGQVQGNGRVVLVNPNGFLIGRTAQLNVNSLVVSSLSDIGYDPVTGRYRFSSSAANPGAVVNQGTITAGHGGSVTLLGGTVSNSGTIVADYGTVNLAAGRVATLDLAGDGLLRLEVGSELSSNASGAASAVQNSGSISASGGQVVLTASALKDVFTNLVNNTGVVRANRIDNSGGTIQLLGPGGDVTSSGTLDASAGDAKSTGGTVTMSGERVGLFGDATVDVSGSTGGGTAFIGGGDHGSNPDVPNAQQTVVSSGATIDADAGTSGNGGHVVVWSDDFTNYGGNLSAHGGSVSGNGGDAEVSGKQSLAFTGGADLTAAHGAQGTLLLDPDSLTIDGTSPQPAGMTGRTYNFTDDSGQSTSIGTGAIETLLATGSVTLDAVNSITMNGGTSIDVSGVSGAHNSALTLDSRGTVTLGGTITMNNGAVNVTAEGSTLTMQSGSAITTTGNITLHGASDVTLGNLSGATVQVTSDTGSILGTNQGTALSGTDVTLTAATDIGTLPAGALTLANLPGSPVSVSASNSLAASTTGSGASTINLSLATVPSISTGGISLGSGSGAVVLQTGGDLDVATLGSPIAIGNSNTASVGLLSTGGTLTLPGTGVGTDFTPQNLLLEGATDVLATGGQRTLTLSSPGNLIFDSGAAGGDTALNTSATQLDATIGNGNALTVTQTGGPLALGAITDTAAGGGLVTIHAAGLAITAGTGNHIAANGLTIDGASIGTSGTSLNTTVGTLDATSTGGGIFVSDSGALGVTANATGGDVRVGSGTTMSVASATGNNVALSTGGSNNDLTLNGSVTASAGQAHLTSTGAIKANAAGDVVSGSTGVNLAAATAVGTVTNFASLTGSPVSVSTNGTLAASTTDGGGTINLDVTGAPTVAAGGIVLGTGAPATGTVILQSTIGNLNLGGMAAGAVSLGGVGNTASVALSADAVSGILTLPANTSVTDAHTLLVQGKADVVGSSGSRTLAFDAGDLDFISGAAGGATTLNTTVSQLDATIGNGNALTVTQAGGPLALGAITDTAAGGGLVTIHAAGLAITAGTGNHIAANGLTIDGASIGASGTPLSTTVGTLNATSTGGGIFVSDSAALGVTAAATGGDVQVGSGTTMSVTSASGSNVTLSTGGSNNDLTINGSVTASAGQAHLTSTGAITAGGVGDVVSGTTGVNLSAATAIGAVTNFASLAGTPVSVSTSGTLAASTTSNGGTINLNLAGVPTIAAGGIALGSAGAASGTVVLQSTSGDLNLGSMVSDAISIRSGNTAKVGLSANAVSGILTLPASTSVTDAAPNTLLVQGGADVVGSGGSRALTFNAGDLDFISGAAGGATTLNTTVSQLDASISHSATLSVTQGSIPLALGAISDPGGSVSISSLTTGFTDDGNSSTRVAADSLTLSAVSLGLSSGRIQTTANHLTLDTSAGDAYVDQSGGVSLQGSITGALDVQSSGTLSVAASLGATTGMSLKTTGPGSDINVDSAVSVTSGAATVQASGAVSGTGLITANGLTVSGSAIGGGTTARLNTSVGTLDATSSNGGIYVGDSGPLTLTASATGGTVDVQAAGSTFAVTSATGNGVSLNATAAGGVLSLGTVSGGNGDITLSASGASGRIDIGGAITNTTQVTATAGTLASPGVIDSTGGSVSTGTFTATGAVVGNSGTPISTNAAIVVANANNGGVNIHDTGAGLDLTAFANLGGIQVSSDGPMVVSSADGQSITLTTNGVGNDLSVNGSLTTPGVAQLTSSGAITTGAGDVISGTAGVTLSAATGIGTVTNFTTLAGSPVNVATSGALAAAVTDDAGQINLNLVGIPTFAGAGAISLGSGAGVRTGTVVLQSAGDLNVASLPAGAISIGNGNGNAVSLGFSSGGTLTLPAIGGFTDAPAQNLSVQGTQDVLSSGGADPRQLSFSAQQLNFSSGSAGGATTLNTSVSQLNASIGNAAALTVNQTGVTPLTLGAVTDTGGAVTITSTGAITDDGDPTTLIAANNGVTLSGTAIGTSADPIGTQTTTVHATASTGDVYLLQNGALTLFANAPNGLVNARTSAGLTVATALSGTGASFATSGAAAPLVIDTMNAGTGPVSLTTTGAGSDITIGNVQTTGAATIQATGALDTGAGNSIAANGLTVTATAIGNSAIGLYSQVGNLTATSTNGGIYVYDVGPLTVAASATGGPVSVQTATGGLTVTSATGNGINLASLFGGTALTVNGPLNAGGDDVTLAASGAGGQIHLDGAITNAGNVTAVAGTAAAPGAIDSNGATIFANTFTATGASIGTAGSPINTSASSVTATAASGGIDVQDSGDLTLAANATGGAVQVSAGGSLTVTSASGTDVTLTASGAGNTLSLDGPISATGTAQLTSPGAILAGAGNQLSASNAILRGTVVGALGTPLNTTLGTLDVATTNGGIFVLNTDAVTLAATATNGTINVQSTGGSMTVSSANGDGVTLGTGGTGSALTVANGGIDGHAGDVSLTTSGAASDITLNGAVTTTGKIAIAASGDASNVVLNVPVSSPSDISITAGSAASAGNILTSGGTSLSAPSIELVGAAIGSSAAALNTAAATLSATSRNGGIFIDNAGALTLTAAATGGALDVQAGGPLTVSSASGSGVTLATTSAGIGVNGAINGGAGPVSLTAGGAGGTISLNGSLSTTGNVTLLAGTTAAPGAITAASGADVTGASLTATGTTLGTAANPLNTAVGSLTTTSTNGGTFIDEADGVTLNSSATGGPLNVKTNGGAITVTAASGNGVTLSAGGAGSGITVNGLIAGGSDTVALTAGGPIVEGAGGSVTGAGLEATGTAIGSASAPLSTNVPTLSADATAGGIYVANHGALALQSIQASGDAVLSAQSGDLTIGTFTAGGTASLTASSGAIVDASGNSTPLTAAGVTLLANSIGAASTATGPGPFNNLRFVISADTLDATSTAGGVYIDAMNGLASARVRATGGAAGNIELVAPNGDLNLLAVNASNTLLLSAGLNIYGLPGMTPITAQAAELRAGDSDPAAGHIGTVTQPLELQLNAGNTLKVFVPSTIDTHDATRAPATLPSSGVTTTLTLFGAPSLLALEAGFGQFQGLDNGTLYTSSAESLVRSIQNQTTVVQNVVGLDWSSFDPNVSLFGTLDPPVCMPPDQRDEEQGKAGC